MVRIGGKTLPGQMNWAAMTHEQLYAAVVGGNEPSVVYGVSDKWISLGNNMLDSAMNLHQQVASTSSGWQGEAAESARNAVGQLVSWSGKAAQTAQFMGHQLNQQGQVMETAKNNMPGPVNFDLKTAAMVEPGLSGFANSVMDSQAGQQLAAEAHARAIDVATTMENDSAQIDAATPEFEPVPTVISPNQVGTLSPRIMGTPQQAGVPLSATQGTPAVSPELADRMPVNGTAAQSYGTPAQPPTAGAPGTSQSYPDGSSGTQAQGYQAPPASSPSYQPNAPYGSSSGYPGNQQPVNPGSGPGSFQPPNIYTQPSGSTSTSSYPDSYNPGPGMPSPQGGYPSWPSGGPSGGNPGGGSPYGGPIGAGPIGTGPFGGGPFGSNPVSPNESIPGGVRGGGPGGLGGEGGDSVRSYQPGAISSRLGSGAGPTGARANAGASTAAGAAEEAEASGGSLGAAGRAGSSSGMPGGMGSGGGKRKEEDKEHKSAKYVEGEEIFEPLGGELPPPVIGERRTRPAK